MGNGNSFAGFEQGEGPRNVEGSGNVLGLGPETERS